MIIKVVGHDKKIFLKPQSNNPWSAFFSELETAGAQIVTSGLSTKFDVLIANSHSKKMIRKCKKFGVLKENRILILWEPKEVNGKLYKTSTLNSYGHIFTPSSDWLKGQNVYYFNWPQGKAIRKTQSDIEWLKRKNKIVFIGSNKYSISRGELYSLRREVLKNDQNNKSIDLFGHGWNQNIIYDILSILSSLLKTTYRNYSLKSLKLFAKHYNNYKGITNNKQKTLSKYKFALVIENSNDYVSEKLFESLESQCIVIYVGINLNKHLNKNIAVQSNASAVDISKKLTQILCLSNTKQLTLMKKQRKEYLKKNKDWENYKILKNLARDSVNLLNI